MSKTIKDISHFFQSGQKDYLELTESSGKVLKVSLDQPVSDVAKKLINDPADLVMVQDSAGQFLGVTDPRAVVAAIVGGVPSDIRQNFPDQIKNDLLGFADDDRRDMFLGRVKSALLDLTGGNKKGEISNLISTTFSNNLSALISPAATTAYRCTQFPHIVFDDPCPKHGCPCEPLL